MNYPCIYLNNAPARSRYVVHKRHGAELFRFSRFHTGNFAGEWLVVTRYANWTAYAKAQDGLAKDDEFHDLLKRVHRGRSERDTSCDPRRLFASIGRGGRVAPAKKG